MTNKLYVRSDTGIGKPLVLLHGMFGDGTQWVKISNILNKEFRVIVVDLLGHGQSPRPENAQYTDTEHALALRKTLESIKATKDLTVVGYSMGGSIALTYSSLFPEEVEQLYLISTPFYLTPEQMLPINYEASLLLTKITTGFFQLVENVLRVGGKVEKLVAFGNKSNKFHKMIGAYDNQLDVVIVRKNLDNLVREFDFVGHLKNVKAPITFYVGKKDIFVIQSQLESLRQFQPNIDIQRLDIMKIDHMLVQNLPNEIASLLMKNKQQLLNVGVDEGKGDNLVLIHGIESSSSYWQPLVPALSEHNRVIAVDLLGFGQSPKPLNLAYSLDDQVEYLKRTLDNLKVEKFHLAGHSLGSLVALSFAAKYPQRVTKLDLLAPVFVPNKVDSNNPIIKRIHFIDRISDGSYLYSHAALALGYKRLSRYIPSIRSIRNSVNQQDSIAKAKLVGNIPTTIAYGTKDGLIDQKYIKKVSRNFKNNKPIRLDGLGHNFLMYRPTLALDIIEPDITHSHQPSAAKKLPKTFLKQFTKLTAPILLLKSLVYITVGILLFTDYAKWTIVAGLSFSVIRLGYSYIRGAFSLKNEQLSYVAYIFLGLLVMIFGYGLLDKTQLALDISTLVICTMIIFSGISKLIVSLAWTTDRKTKMRLALFGLLMTSIGLLAISGGLISTKLIIMALAIVLISRGLEYGIYAISSIALAYVRGFNLK